MGYVNALNYEKGGEGEYKQGAGGDVLGQGVIAACGDGVSGFELCIARCVLCPGHIGDGGGSRLTTMLRASSRDRIF